MPANHAAAGGADAHTPIRGGSPEAERASGSHANLPAATSFLAPRLDTRTPLNCVSLCCGGASLAPLTWYHAGQFLWDCSPPLGCQSLRSALFQVCLGFSGCTSSWALYQFPGTAVTEDHRLRGLKQQEFILLQFWRPENKNRGVRRVGSFWGALRENLSPSSLPASGGAGNPGCSWTGSGLAPSLPVFTWCSPCVLCPNFPFLIKKPII